MNIPQRLCCVAYLAAERSDKADQLRAILGEWRKEVGALLPSSNPNFKARPRANN